MILFGTKHLVGIRDNISTVDVVDGNPTAPAMTSAFLHIRRLTVLHHFLGFAPLDARRGFPRIQIKDGCSSISSLEGGTLDNKQSRGKRRQQKRNICRRCWSGIVEKNWKYCADLFLWYGSIGFVYEEGFFCPWAIRGVFWGNEHSHRRILPSMALVPCHDGNSTDFCHARILLSHCWITVMHEVSKTYNLPLVSV